MPLSVDSLARNLAANAPGLPGPLSLASTTYRLGIPETALSVLQRTLPGYSLASEFGSLFKASSLAASDAMKPLFAVESRVADLAATFGNASILGSMGSSHYLNTPSYSLTSEFGSIFNASSLAASVAMKPLFAAESQIADLHATFASASAFGCSGPPHNLTTFRSITDIGNTFRSSSLAALLGMTHALSDSSPLNPLAASIDKASLASSLASIGPLPDFSFFQELGKDFDMGTGSSMRALTTLPQSMGELGRSFRDAIDHSAYSAFSNIRTSLQSVVEDRRGFQIPQAVNIQNAFDAYQSDFSGYFKKNVLTDHLLDKLSSSMESMRMPALDVIRGAASIKGVLDVHRIASVIDGYPAFGRKAEDLLRHGLGDWRDEQRWSPKIFDKTSERVAFYLDRGLDKDLTAFSPQAFETLAKAARLQTEARGLSEMYGDPVPADERWAEGFERSAEASRHLIAFERYIRLFIDEAMTQQFGADWPKRQLPNGVYESWSDKRAKAAKHGAVEVPIIQFADFTDYVNIITKRDNWRLVFQGIFRTQEGVRESFHRLEPVRICTMHSRDVTNEDMLFLYVEIKRITSSAKLK
jgi:hypothetical protein